MSTLGSGGSSPAATASTAAVDNTSSHWVPHGAVLTACVVGVNVLVILLIIFLFWRFFCGEEGPSAAAGAADGAEDDDDDDGSAPVASPWASRWRHEEDLGARPVEDVALALPVYIYSSAAGADDDGGKAEECAVCIVELRDGDSASLLPQCGHRFHAACVGAWLRLHTTCPLCRARVVAPPPRPPPPPSPGTPRTTTTPRIARYEGNRPPIWRWREQASGSRMPEGDRHLSASSGSLSPHAQGR